MNQNITEINLTVNGLNFNYKAQQTVLNNLNFNVKRGELLAILGPNGAGKTTLLKCLNAIHKPKGGSVLIQDTNVFNLKPGEIAKLLGYVPQRIETASLTVFDAILMGRKPYLKWKVRDHDLKIVDAAIKRLSLENLALRSLDHLSGGELQKVSIARALVQEPEVLLLDEPTSSLDLKNQLDILRMVRKVVTGHNVSAVMTMHDLNTALRYADKFLFLKKGNICSCGGPECVTAEIIEEVYDVPVEIEIRKGKPIIHPLEEI